MVFGPLFPGTISGLKDLNTSNGIVWSLFGAQGIPDTTAQSKISPFSHVSQANADKKVWTSVTALATAHVKALTTPEASNQRFLVTDGVYDMQELADIVHASSAIPEAAKERVPKGVPEKRLCETHYKVDNRKAKEILELESSSLEETVIELVQQLLKLEKTS